MIKIITNSIVSKFSNVESIDYEIYEDSSYTTLVTSILNTTKTNLDVDIDETKDYYLRLRVNGGNWLGPYIMSDKLLALIKSNPYIANPVVDIKRNLDSDGNLIDYIVSTSDFVSEQFEHVATSFFIEDDAGNTIFRDVKDTRYLTSIHVDKDLLQKDSYYKVTAIHYGNATLTSNPSSIDIYLNSDGLIVKTYDIKEISDIDTVIRNLVDSNEMYDTVVKNALISKIILNFLNTKQADIQSIVDDLNIENVSDDFRDKVLAYKDSITTFLTENDLEDLMNLDTDSFVKEVKTTYGA